MKRPSSRTMLMGHPVIAVPVTLALGTALLAAIRSSDTGIGLIAVAILAAVGKASKEARAYRAWAAEWQAMDPDAPRRSGRPVRQWTKAAGLVALLATIVFNSHRVAYLAGYSAGWLSIHPAMWLVPGLVALALLARRMRHSPNRPRRTRTVAVIAKPVLPMPTIDAAYAALPDYCRHLLRR